MRLLKLCMLLGIVGAMAIPAGAITYNEDYSGPVKWKITDWDMGAIYFGDDGGALAVNTLYDGVGTLNGLDQTPAPGAIGTEDSWGIFVVTDIYKDDGSNDLLWSSGNNGQELVGIFYGGVDNGLYISGGNGQQTIQSSGLTFMVYQQTAGNLTPALEALGSTGRDGVDPSAYAGVGYIWTDTNINGVVDPGELTADASATLVIAGNTTGGVAQLFGSTGPANETANFTPQSATTGTGEKTFYVDVTGGQWQFGPPFQYEASDYYFASSQFGDMFIDSSAQANPPSGSGSPFGDWTILSEDPVRANAEQVIPEPLTMLALASGLVGLGGYIRRRNRM